MMRFVDLLTWASIGALVCVCAALELDSTPSPDPNMGKTCQVNSQVGQCGALVCHIGRCSPCTSDQECEVTYSKFRCDNGDCIHKTLFPMETSDIITTVIMIVIIAAASGGGGIGGGGALVPLYVLVAGFQPAGAIPLSKATIFGGACANLVMNVRKRHPTADRPLIDYNLAVLFVPMQLLGTMVGVLCNKTFPNWLIVVWLIFFLSWLTHVTFGKAMVIYRAETGAQESITLSVNATQDEAQKASQRAAAEIAEERHRHLMSVGGEELQTILKTEAKVPFFRIFHLLLVWLFVIFIALLKGGEGASLAGVTCASALYWVLFLIPFPCILGLVLLIGRQARMVHHRKEALGFYFHPGDVRWDARNTLVYPLINICVGFGAGALGIGGGTMTGPLMLHLNMNTQVVAATAAFMILFTSSITSAQFIILGVLEPSYGAWFASFGFLASMIGQTVMAYLLRKYRRQSLVVFCITAILGLSAVLLGIQGIRRIILDVENQAPMGFRPLCGLAP